MFNGNYYKDIRISSGFGVDRGSYKHSGVDYPGSKKDDIKCLIAGKVDSIVYAKNYFGTQCTIYSNPKFIGGVNENLYHSYCHLFKVNVKDDQFVDAGAVLGKMGNSGGSYTKYDINGKLTNTWRKITAKEQNDPKCNYAVHLHLWFYQPCNPGRSTKLLNTLKKYKIVSDNSLGDTHFYQWSKLIIAPRVIYSYFKKLKG